MDVNYHNKYLKYKNKYLNLQKSITPTGGDKTGYKILIYNSQDSILNNGKIIVNSKNPINNGTLKKFLNG